VVPILLDPHTKDTEQPTDRISTTDNMTARLGRIPCHNGAGAKQFHSSRPSESKTASYTFRGRHFLIKFSPVCAVSHRTTKNPIYIRS
jgi:hypothetical protein